MEPTWERNILVVMKTGLEQVLELTLARDVSLWIGLMLSIKVNEESKSVARSNGRSGRLVIYMVIWGAMFVTVGI